MSPLVFVLLIESLLSPLFEKADPHLRPPSTGCSLRYIPDSGLSRFPLLGVSSLKYIPDSGLPRFPLLGVSVCTQWHVKHQHCSRTGSVQKNYSILRKNTIFTEHPLYNIVCGKITLQLTNSNVS